MGVSTADIRDHELANLATFCPRLERLTLNMCGRLDDDVLEAWKKGFKSLRYLSLYGEGNGDYLKCIKSALTVGSFIQLLTS